MHVAMKRLVFVSIILQGAFLPRYGSAGGRNAEHTEFYNSTWVMAYLTKGQYQERDEMRTARSDGFSGLIGGEGAWQMVVAGGQNAENGFLSSTEIFTQLDGTWRDGKLTWAWR